MDWSWDYHRAVNSFRRHPRVAGWLYTEHHDVINEWNGYWRFDRSDKITGLEDFVEGMTLRDFHSPLYVVVGTSADLSRSIKVGETVEVPLWASFLTGTFFPEAGTLAGAALLLAGMLLFTGQRATEPPPRARTIGSISAGYGVTPSA